jgi:hypothetical protein
MVSKQFKQQPNQAAIDGDETHQAFARRVKSGTPLPLYLRGYEDVLKKFADAPGEKVAEQKLCFNARFELVDWYAQDAYLRVISDLTILNGNYGVTIDYKTGKPYSDFTQLELTAASIMVAAPEIDQINMGYLWTKTKKLDTKLLPRSKTPDVWASLMPRVQAYQNAHAANDFPPKPNFLCEKYCPVTTCQFWHTRQR